ncbi:MAG: hypothetical protein ACKO96_44095, partial [Flammeovirgaceae bacterium]
LGIGVRSRETELSGSYVEGKSNERARFFWVRPEDADCPPLCWSLHLFFDMLPALSVQIE